MCAPAAAHQPYPHARPANERGVRYGSRQSAVPASAHTTGSHLSCACARGTGMCAGTRSTILYIKQRMIGHVYAMLTGRPELERFFLACLVNKLGDPEKKVGRSLADAMLMNANES